MERKAANDDAKNRKLQEQLEAEEAAKWATGSKGGNKKEEEARKKAEAAAKKAEREALLAAEEREIAAKKPTAPIKGSKVAAKKTAAVESFASDAKIDLEEYSASGIDAALDLMEITEKGVTPVQVNKGLVEKHPEKRMKSAWAAFEEREMPILKEENPGLRLSQLKQMLQKKWKKSPENPMNQAAVAYNATQDEIREQVSSQREEVMEKMRVK
ncbi:hypothetical protein HDU67_005710 [Dinochytrium kinnereticum]|nr:hypothetical protein HDU67_005710 [Dinochytrium kinnereticum]